MYLLLICLLINSVAPNKDNLISLEGLDYFIHHTFTAIRIVFKYNTSGTQWEIKCPKHVKCTRNVVQCSEGESVQLDLNLTNGISSLVIPFTVLCNSSSSFKNAYFIENLEITHDDKRIYSGWHPNKIENFSHNFVVCTSSAGETQMISMTDNALILTGIKHQTWYQVCAANVDKNNKRSLFKCAKVLFNGNKYNANSNTNTLSVNNMKAFSRKHVINYKNDGDIISELVTLDLIVNCTIVSKENRLSISWNITNGMRGSIFQYVLLLRTQSNVCEYAIYFICSNCAPPLNSSFLKQTDQNKIFSYKNCSKNLTEQFDRRKTNFHFVKSLNKTMLNVKGEFYAINFLGVHSITLPQIASKNSEPLNTVAIVIMVITVIFSLTLLLVFLSQKDLSFHLRWFKNNSKHETTISVTRQAIIESQTDATVTFNSSNSTEITQGEDSVYFNVHSKLKTRTIEMALPLSQFDNYYNQVSQHKGAKMIKQFRKLMKESHSQESLLNLTTIKGSNANKLKKNRFVNIVPYDQNRVKVGNIEYPEDYINASYIPFDNDAKKYEYIATQGPNENTLPEFWQMIWQENIDFVIMLTELNENNKSKCAQYWPDKIGDSLSIGDYKILLLDDVQHDGHVERKMIISDEYNCRKKVIQFHMNTWLDECAPNIEYFDKFLFRFHEVATNASSSPYLAHCSAGVGRTGTFICIDKIIKNFTKGEQFVNIYETVLMLRRYRMMMVQKQAQYLFIHEYINHFLNKYMIFDQSEEDVYFNDNQKT